MAKPVPGTMLLQMANDHAYRAMLASSKGDQADAMGHLATAVQQIAGGLREALQAIYEEVD
jgi:hypothetical protein